MGPELDGVAPHMADYDDDVAFRPADLEPTNIAEALRKSGAEVLLCYLPVGSEKAVKHYAEACLAAGVAMVNCVPVFLASDPEWAKKFQRRRPAHRRRRHQEPGRRDHRPSLAGAAVRRPWRRSRPDLPAQHRGQHRLPQHAGAQAAQVEEAFQDGIRPVAARRAARRRGHPHRPVRLHSLAARQQDRFHPPGGARLRRRAARDRTQAVGAGFLEQRRRRHRRSALRQARIGPRRSAARSKRRRPIS